MRGFRLGPKTWPATTPDLRLAAPTRLAIVAASMPEQECGDVLTLASLILTRHGAHAHQISHRLVRLIGNPHRRQFAGSQQACQGQRIPVGWSSHDRPTDAGSAKAQPPCMRARGQGLRKSDSLTKQAFWSVTLAFPKAMEQNMPCRAKRSEPQAASDCSRKPPQVDAGIGRSCTACLINYAKVTR